MAPASGALCLQRVLLIKAKQDPDSYPNILVRVSGYSAFFNDLTPEAQNEIISRSMQH